MSLGEPSVPFYVIHFHSDLTVPALFLLRSASKQWHQTVTGRMVADALQRELPMLVGLPLDRPFDFYADVARSYHARCSMTLFAVVHRVGLYATRSFAYTNFPRSNLPPPLLHTYTAAQDLHMAISTRQGRAMILDAVRGWREELETGHRHIVFYDGADDYLDYLERFVRSAFVVVGRRVTMGAVGYDGSFTRELVPMYVEADFF